MAREYGLDVTGAVRSHAVRVIKPETEIGPALVRLMASLAVLACLALPVHAQGKEEVLSRMESFYSKAEDLSADFRQTTHLEGFGKRESTGTLYLKKPGMARWDYRTPVKQQIYATEEKTILYDPAQNQAIVQKTAAHPDAQPALGLLSRVEEWREQFDIRLLPEGSKTPGKVLLELLPRSGRQIEKIEAEADPKTGAISRLVLFQEGGSRVAFDFEKVSINQGLKKSFFNFTIPRNAEVLEYP
jgi:outer membrane lipoprotein carrier protein